MLPFAKGKTMTQVHFETAFQCLPIDDLDKWIEFNQERLIGSAIFTMNDSLASKIVRWAESWRNKGTPFIPSHTGSIVKYKNHLYVFDMKPLRAKKTLLIDYLINTEDKYALVLRDFPLNPEMFSANILEHEGEWYPYMSAIRSVFTKRQSKWRRHCSELHLRELQKQDLFQKVNPEITPDELYHILAKGE